MIEEHIANTLGEYVTLTMTVRRSWTKGNDIPDPWFRGLESRNHVLLPGWYRLGSRSDGMDEDDLQDEFQRRSVPLLDGQTPQSLWEWYFLMQHYGLPTRLLDWSESSLVGLYFAVGDWKGKGGDATDDAVVWMLHPWSLNKWSVGKGEVFRYDEECVAKYLPKQLFDADRSPENPVALMPLYNSRRLTAQRGVFTMHGTSPIPLEEMVRDEEKVRLVRITIPQEHVVSIRDELLLTGVSDVTLFPEMPYLCQDILKNWKLAGAPIRDRD